MAGESQQTPNSMPDPSVLTTEQMLLSVNNLEELTAARREGAFNAVQMSGVLLYQHKEFLTSSPDHWLSHFFYWIINHPLVGYLIYLLGTLLELLFLSGFFTRKFDRILLYAFILFLLLDLFLMRIYYWELSPFMITLLYSRYRRPTSLS